MTNKQYETILSEMRTIRALLEEMKTVRIEKKVSEIELNRFFDATIQMFDGGVLNEQMAEKSND